jgi:hypothetical protein
MGRGSRGDDDVSLLSRADLARLRHGAAILHELGLDSSEALAQNHADERRELGEQQE